MTALTRRRSDNDHQETWHIYFSDVRIGTIGVRGGLPTTADEWGWDVGFYPGMEPRARRSGSAATFDEARAAFEGAWRQLEPTLTEGSYEEWRRAAPPRKDHPRARVLGDSQGSWANSDARQSAERQRHWP